MCGIVGYVSKKKVIPFLLDGLYRLEYRGYDSAGVVVCNDSDLKIVKQIGRIKELEKKIRHENMYDNDFNVGISHTRWATHGCVSIENSHPHVSNDGRFAVVHNGIIENYKELKDKLIKDGYDFKSETDTEVIVALIEKHYTGNLEETVRLVLTHLTGAYGLAVISKLHPNMMVGAKNGSPLVVGIGKEENVIASDVAAIRSVTDNVVYLEDGQMVTVTLDGYNVSSVDKESIAAEVCQIDWSEDLFEMGDYDTYMKKEIHEQSDTILNTIRGRLLKSECKIKLRGLEETAEYLKKVTRITIVACGTSWHAALVAKHWIEDLASIHVEVDYAAEFRYRNPIISENHIVIAISQSGETADTIGAIREAQVKGAKVLAITNVVGSTIARESDAGVFLHAGPEVGVASTKAFTGQMIALLLVAMYLGRMNHLSMNRFLSIIDEIENLPGKIEEVFLQEEHIKTISQEVAKYNNALYLGRGVNFPIALEGALKLKEISYIHAEGYSAAEMKHGPIALIDEQMPTVVIATKDFQYEKVVSNIQEIKARNGQVIAIATEGDTDIDSYADFVIHIPKTLDLLTPFLAVVPLQLISYYAALENGCDVDKPRNLAKSVTVE